MSLRVLGILIIAFGVLGALGVFPIRIDMPRANRYWQTKPTKFSVLSRIGVFLFFGSFGAFIAWYDMIPEKYRIYVLFPLLLGLILGVGGQAMEQRVNPGPTIAALTLPDEPVRQRRESNFTLIVLLGVVAFFVIFLWQILHH